MTERLMNSQCMDSHENQTIGACLHLKSGRTRIPKACIYGYECWHCLFDQWLDEFDEGDRKAA